ncbi:MAG: sigma-54 dependent transcriptional regulator, partial [Lentisphaerota bacterium]
MNNLKALPLIGNSRDMLHILQQIRQVAHSNIPVLIRGESGVGKELVAETIQLESARARKPFIRIYCAAVPENAIESELFGKTSGDAQVRPGAFETAHGGTVLLDEIAALPLPAQTKLLHVLQEREFEQFGGNRTIQLTARLLATTNRPLEQLVQDNRFHEGLYYQLSLFPLYIPPLRERKTDIPLLINHFIKKCNSTFGTTARGLTSPSLEMLMNHPWPGNVRELEDSIEHAIHMSEDGVIQPHHLPPTLRTGQSTTTPQLEDLKSKLTLVEKGLIVDALRANDGNVAATARQLGLTVRIMGLRVQKYGINPDQFKRRLTQNIQRSI